VLTAVDFDDEAVPNGYKIHDIRSNRPLAAKFVPSQSPIAKRHPKPMLGFGLTPAQFPRDFARH
jgi:hypothetical protein